MKLVIKDEPREWRKFMLQFCGHHYRKHEVALSVQGAQVVADARGWKP